MANNVKQKRSHAKGRFTRTCNLLEKALDDGPKEADEEDISMYFSDVEKAWSVVEERHEDYVITLNEGEDTDPEEEWLVQIQSRYHKVRKRYVEFKHTIRLKSELTALERARDVEYDMFVNQGKILAQSINSKHSADTISHAMHLVLNQFEETKRKHLDFTVKAPETDKGKNSGWLNTLVDQLAKFKSDVDTYLKNELCIKSETEKPNLEKPEKSGNEKSVNGPAMKLQKMPLPKFNGDARYFHRFKREFEELVRPHVSKKEDAFILRQCLGEKVLETMGSCDFTCDQIMKRLDEKYGDPSKMTDAIISEITGFKKIENDDNKRIIEFINLIDKANHDLKGVKMEHEINNTNVVSLIESKLPKNLAMNWYRMIHTVDSKVVKSNKFPSLLQFLCTERNAIEYGMVDFRLNSAKKCDVNLFESKGDISKCLIHKTGGHKTEECRNYKDLPVDQKHDLLMKNFACFACLTPEHKINDCKVKSKCAHEGCDKFHHESLHVVEPVNFTNFHGNKSRCLFPVMHIETGRKSQYVNVLWDTCASVSLITESKARDLKLSGVPSKLSIVMVGGVERCVESKRYKLPLKNLLGKIIHVDVYSISKISDRTNKIDLPEITRYFPDVDKKILRGSEGEVDVLIGYNYAALHPTPVSSAGQLNLLSNSFGQCVAGCFPNSNQNYGDVESVNFISSNVVSDFFSVESLGVECQPRCGSCQCGTCALGSKNCTLKEQKELELIEKNLSLSPEGYWEAEYPWIRDPKDLPDNRNYALKLLKSTEFRLKKNKDKADAYCDQINDMISRNVARKLSKEELDNYKGPKYYIAHHAVAKPSSKTTPLRIVFNSSALFRGHVLNDYWAKGPNVFLNTLFGILIRFRENYFGYVGDIRKMYNSIRIPLKDQHCHRFLWRDLNSDKSPDTYVITRANMGDRPAGSMACAAVRKTANNATTLFPAEAEIILNSSFMDDIIDSDDSLETVNKLTGNISNILGKVDFHIKGWTITSNCSTTGSKEFKGFGEDVERVLGVTWDSQNDLLKFGVSLNFSRKDSITSNAEFRVDENWPAFLTKRIVLSKLNGIYDPLGLLGAFVIKGKILMRELWTADDKLSWDCKIPDEMYLRWIEFFKEMLELSKIDFKRCTKPLNAEGNPILIVFSDASKMAYGTVCYIRWRVGGAYVSRILASKSRIAPVKVVTIVRLELLAALLGKRLRNTIEKECRFKFDQVIHIVDSEIVRSMIQRESYGFNTFTSTKIGEIQSGTSPSEWHWISGGDNIADILSRGEDVSKLGVDSEWQNGPKFLSLPISEWPISQECHTKELPETVERNLVAKIDIKKSLISIERFSNYHRLIRVTARILALKCKPYSLKVIKNQIKVDGIKNAVSYWIKIAQLEIKNELECAVKGVGTFRKLRPILNDDGVYVVGGRAERWFEGSYNKQLIPILPKNEFSRLIVEMKHRSRHGGIDTDIATVREEYWIVGLRRICCDVKKKCVTCRMLLTKPVSQKMGLLPVERLKPSPAWNSVGIDLFGPYHIRGEVNKRSTGKCYGVIFVCLPSTAVHVDIASNYSTDAFLSVYRRFTSIRGCPSVICSDYGSQLVGASKVLQDISKNWDWDKIMDPTISKGAEWKFSPGDAPWWNGCCESLVKSLKKSISLAVGENRLSFSELQTVCYEAANLANERPIGTKPGAYSEFTYLCPNDLILGRATSKVPQGPWDHNKSITKRFRFIQSVIDTFWKKWTMCYFPNLIIEHKWHHNERNMKVGDIVVIIDKNEPRGMWKLGKISAVEPGIDGNVRRVSVQYKNKASSSYVTVERPVQRLSVILPVEEQNN